MDLNNKNILLVRLGKIGDIIIASSVFEILKNKFLNCRITLLTLKSNAEVLQYNPKIDSTVFTSKNISLYLSLFKLRNTHSDFLLDLNDDPSKTSSIIRMLVKSKTSAGFDFGTENKPTIAIAQPDKSKSHILDRIKVLLNAIDIYPQQTELKPVLYLGKKEEIEVVNQLVVSRDFKIVAINISAGSPIRIWKEEYYSEIINTIAKNDGWKIIILYAKKDYDKAKRLSLTFNSDKILRMKYHTFQHFAAYIRRSNLLITPDTSAVHVASAFNVPVIALYPGVEWNFASWQPLSDLKISLLSKTESIIGISVEEVLKAFDTIKKEIN